MTNLDVSVWYMNQSQGSFHHGSSTEWQGPQINQETVTRADQFQRRIQQILENRPGGRLQSEENKHR